MRRQSTDEGEGGLDSLLDTMTNVVGILVIVLVVTQLGVGDAVKRITNAIKIDAQQLADAQKKLEAATAERDALLAAMSGQDSEDATTDDYEQRLQTLQQQIEQQQKVLDQLNAAKQKNEGELAARLEKLENSKQRQKALEEARQQVAKLDESWKADNARLRQLQAQLADTPVQAAPPPREVTLPNPRPAPEGAEQLTIVCAHNKVYLVPPNPMLEQIRKQAQLKCLQVLQKLRRNFNPLTGEGADLFVEEFNKQPLRDPSGYFEVQLYNSRGTPRLRLVPRETAGEDERAVKGARSRFQSALRSINRKQYFLRFYVWTDSFDIYITTRRIVSDMGLLAGWEPQSDGWTFTTHLGGKFQLGPKPPPAPPKPAPPGPPKPKKPANVID